MSSDRLLLGTRKGSLILERNGSGWRLQREAHLGARVSYAMVDSRTGELFACLDHGHWGAKLSRSRDAGETWQELPAPKYPEGEELKPGTPAVLKYLWCLVEGLPSQPGRLYMGTVPGGLFVSDDHGESWQLDRPLWDHPSRKVDGMWFGGGMDDPGIHSVLVDPRTPDVMLVGVSCAGVFAGRPIASEDTWRPRNKGLNAEFLPNPDSEVGHDPHLVVQCQSRPDVLWQQNHCGIFRSVDRGQTWKSVSTKAETAHFGFAIAADPNDENTAWVIPAESDEVRVACSRRLQVCRTSDGGQTWQSYSSGLPQEHCYDFAFRHALDQSGDRLAFGTACGSLYISEDRGESWQSFGSHLPPIYSARFA